MDRQAQYCLECEWKLRKFHKFKQTCIKADKVIKALQLTAPRYNNSFCRKQLSPPTLEPWDGRNSKIFYYLYVDKITSESPTNTGVLNPVSAINYYDNKIRVKKMSSLRSADVLMKRTLKLLNPITGNALPAATVPGDVIDTHKNAKSIDDVLFVDSIHYLDVEHNAENVDSFDVSNEDIVGTLSYGINDDDKDNVPILMYNIDTDTVEPLGVIEDDKDDVPLLRDNDVANATDKADLVRNKDLLEDVGQIHPEQLQSIEITKSMNIQEMLIKEEHCYTSDNSNKTIDLSNVLLSDANVNTNANSSVNNHGFDNVHENNNKQTYDTTYKSLQKLTANEIVRQCKTKSLIKEDVIKRPKPSNERNEYFNLASFVKLDKTKSKKELLKDMETSEIFTIKSEGECSNDMESQNSVKIKKVNSNAPEHDESQTDAAPYSHDDPFYNSEFNNKLHEQKTNDAPRKTLSEFTNVDILSDDQEVKVMYVFDKEKYDLLKENNVYLNNIEVKEEIVEFAPDVVKEEEIQYCEVIQQNDDASEMVLETGNVVQSYETNVVANEADETNVSKTEENEDVADEIEQNEKETQKLSSKCEGSRVQKKGYRKLAKMFKEHDEIRTVDGNVISKEALLNFYGNMENEDKIQITKTITGLKKVFTPKATKILWKLQQKYEKEYGSIFDIEYLNTDEKVRRHFHQKKSSSDYLNAEFKCELCVIPFDNLISLSHHVIWHDPLNGDYVCDLCQTRHKTKAHLSTHRQLHTVVYKCKLCPLITHKKPVMISHFTYHKGMNTICEICGQSYRNARSYSLHLMTHVKDHECNICAQNFVSTYGLKTHKLLQHKNVNLMQSPDRTRCDLCDVVYISQEVYLKHYKKVHCPPTAPTLSRVRAKVAQRHSVPLKECSAETPTKRRKKYNFTEHSSNTESTPTDRTHRGRHASQKFAAATPAIQIAKYNNIIRESNKTDAKTLMDAENSIDEQHMKLVYEDDDDDTNNMNVEIE